MDQSKFVFRRRTTALMLVATFGFCGTARADEALPPPLGLAADQGPVPTQVSAPFSGMRFITLGRVSFESGKWDLNDSAKHSLDTIAAYLAAHSGAERLLLDGHADGTGSMGYNDKLSDQRAAAVQDYLIGKGVDPRLIHWRGHGKRSPTDENWNRLGRRRNRQVELFAVY